MSVIEFLSGISAAGFAGAGLFFYKFYRTSHDKLFGCFAVALWLLAIERVALLLNGTGHSHEAPIPESVVWIYTIRLLAFGVILYAVIDRNRKASGP